MRIVAALHVFRSSPESFAPGAFNKTPAGDRSPADSNSAPLTATTD